MFQSVSTLAVNRPILSLLVINTKSFVFLNFNFRFPYTFSIKVSNSTSWHFSPVTALRNRLLSGQDLHIFDITHSHGSACESAVKATMKVYVKGRNLTPPPPKNPLTNGRQICVGDYFGDIYHRVKFYPNRFRGFVSSHA